MVLAVAAAVMLAAWGSGHTPQIEWSAPEPCPDRAEFVTAIEQYLGRPLDHSAQSPVLATAQVDATSQEFVLTLGITTNAGRSESVASNSACHVLATLAALKIAIAIDPQAGLRGPLEPLEPQPPAPPRDPPPPRAHLPAPRPPPAIPPAPERILGVSARADVSAQSGLLPRPALGLGATVGLRIRRIGVLAGFDQWLSPAVVIDPPHPGRAVVRASTGRATGCWVAGLSAKLELPLCMGIEGGMLTADAQRLQTTRRTRQPWLAVSGGVHLAWVPSPRVAWSVGIPLVVPVLRPGLRTDDGGLFYRAAPIGVRPTTSIELRFR